MSDTRDYVRGGNYYLLRRNGRLEPLGDNDQPPAVTICRRLADFPRLPAGGRVTECAWCHALIGYNPAAPHQNAPKICHACAGVTPLPYDGPR